MAGRINDDDIRTLKDRIDISAVIAPYTTLKGSGTSLMGRCPFHEEKTPSFVVSPGRQTYHCFGCGMRGGVCDFVMAMERGAFRDALELLAD